MNQDILYQEELPPIPLRKYIDRYFLLGVNQIHNSSEKNNLVIPDGTFGLLFIQNKFIKRYDAHSNSNSYILEDSYFFGQKSKSVYYSLEQNSTLSFGIKIKPAGLQLFSQVPGKEILDQVFPSHEIITRDYNNIEDVLFSENNFSCKSEIMNRHLLQKLNILQSDSKTLLDRILDVIHFHQGQIELKSISTQFSISYKKLERLFDKYVGLSPKTYLRIIRFNSTLNSLKTSSNNSLTDISCMSGYYDQNHFIKEVKYFTKLTPKEFYSSEATVLEKKHRDGVAERMKHPYC